MTVIYLMLTLTIKHRRDSSNTRIRYNKPFRAGMPRMHSEGRGPLSKRKMEEPFLQSYRLSQRVASQPFGPWYRPGRSTDSVRVTRKTTKPVNVRDSSAPRSRDYTVERFWIPQGWSRLKVSREYTCPSYLSVEASHTCSQGKSPRFIYVNLRTKSEKHSCARVLFFPLNRS